MKLSGFSVNLAIGVAGHWLKTEKLGMILSNTPAGLFFRPFFAHIKKRPAAVVPANCESRHMARPDLKGRFLVAQPELTDPNFSRTVVYLFDHSEEGAAGVVVNRASKLTIQELSEKIYSSTIEWDKPIMIGGPVSGPLLVVHQDSDWADDEIRDDVYRTVDPDKIHEILQRRLEPSLLVASYAGWGPNQLENESNEGAWAVTDADLRHIFWNEIKDLWDVLMAEIHTRKIGQVLKIRATPIDPAAN